jgi:hypothetical protein
MKRNFSLFYCIQTEAHTAPPIQKVLEAVSQGVKLTTHLHPVPRLGMPGARSALSPYASMAWCLIN